MRTIKRTPLPVVLALALLGVFACAVPGLPVTSQEAVDTAVAETLAVVIQMTQDAGSGVVFDVSNTPTVPSTGTVPSSTATLTPTLTPTFTPTLTPTATNTAVPLTPMISVSVATNCRVGPGKVYRMVGALLVGDVVPVYARNPTGEYWYIRNPDDPGEFCWVWGEYATVTGLISTVPIFTPPPSPTPTYTATPRPSFDATFSDLETCGGYWWLDIDLHNTGTLTFKSVSLTVKDSVTTTTVVANGDLFADRTGCGTFVQKKTLLPGKAVTQSSEKFVYNPDGHKMRATVTLCSATGLSGRCVTESLVFTP